MVRRKQSVLGTRILILAALLTASVALVGQTQSRGNTGRFYPDDPIWKEPAPRATDHVVPREVDDLYDFVENRFVIPAEENKERKQGPPTAENINTLGEVPDSNWYTNRHWKKRMSIAELQRGSGNSEPPDSGATWQIISAKSDGIMPGLIIEDQQKRRYVLKFDPPDSPELSSSAGVISNKFFYALGYNTPEDYIVHFRRDRLSIRKDVFWRDKNKRKHLLTDRAVDNMLKNQPKDGRGMYRALASRWLNGQLVGPFTYKGTRSDDPNDIVPHQDRRELRGLRVFAAWLNHTDVKQMNTMDTLVTENGVRYLKHFLIDFGSTLGSDGNLPKNAWRSHVYPVSPGWPAAGRIVSLGVYTPAYLRADYPKLRGAGHFDYETFDPESWVPDYPNPAFMLMDDADAFWAAKQVAAFTDEEIRAIVETGEFTDSRTAEWVTLCLIRRRDKVAKIWLTRVPPLDRFRVENGRLAFDDLAAAREYEVHWHAYDNAGNVKEEIRSAAGFAVPAVGASKYVAAVVQCSASDAACKMAPVTVFVRVGASGPEVVGIDRGARTEKPTSSTSKVSAR